MTKPKRYEIKTFEQLQNVITVENRIRLIVDFNAYLIHYTTMCHALREKMPNETKVKQNTEIFESHFIWIDDGKEGVSSVKIINKETGEVKTHKIK